MENIIVPIDLNIPKSKRKKGIQSKEVLGKRGEIFFRLWSQR